MTLASLCSLLRFISQPVFVLRIPQREAFDGVQTSASAGEEQYVHLHNTEHQEFESMRSNLPERYYAGREPPPHPHRRQPSFEEGKGKGGADWQSVAFAGERR